MKEKLKLARSPATDTFVAILGSVERSQQELKLDALKDGFTTLVQERNFIVHGAWAVVDERSWVVCHNFLEDDDSIIEEFLEAWRFERFTMTGKHILGMLRQFHDLLEKQTGKKTNAMPRT